MHGEGTYTYSSGNGNSYKGNYKNGKKHGFGVIRENNKIVYEGEFFEGNPHGRGLRYDKNGSKVEVQMEKGRRISNSKRLISPLKSPKKLGLSKFKFSIKFIF